MNKSCLKIFLLFFVCLMFGGERVFARSAGSLDPTFGSGGIVLTNVTSGKVSAIAVQPADGKIIIGGGAGSDKFLLIRYQPNGSLDTTFGENGFVRTQIFEQNNSTADVRGLAIQPDGKIIAVGAASYTVPSPPAFTNIQHLTIVRYNPDGSLDNSFDGDGKVAVLINNFGAYGEEVAIQPDGKIVVSGWNHSSENSFVVARFLSNGSLDNSFDADGIATAAFPNFISKALDVKIQPDGKIVAAGYTESYPVSSFAAARFNPDGSPDISFGAGGKVTANVNAADYGNGLALQADGKIVIAGTTQLQTGSLPQLSMVRLNANGSLDSTFGTDGKITTRFVVNAMSYDASIQADGRILIVGEASETSDARDVALARYLPDGSLDSSFDGDGKVLTPLMRYERGTAMTLDNNGKILVVAETNPGDGTGMRFAVVRYNAQSAAAFSDFDGDGKADISVFRPSSGNWFISNSLNNTLSVAQFGASGDVIAPADFDGDGKTDISVFRPADGGWYRLNSSNNTFSATRFGTSGDLPVAGDFDGDERADIAVFRPSNGSWYRLLSGTNNQFAATQFGASGDKPLVGDFDGDRRIDLAVFRPSDGGWYRINSSNDSFVAARFGVAEDKPVAADYDGDGKTDLAVYRPSVGDWYLINSGNNSFVATHFGTGEDKPSPADYDGDGRADLAVFRPSSGTWYLLRSTNGFGSAQFGASGDVPVPNAFVR